MVYAGNRFRPVLYKHRTMSRKIIRKYLKTTRKDIEFQKRIKKYICYGLPIGTFVAILIINFLFWVFTGKVG